ncbi:methyltransferase domain-containing protein [Salinigranum rubrum]|uniref:methyltransferase domain-containing protein n=1 Tax=Salinigranum rubrum TaxID=755307 RepID=UPI00156FA695|nr:methyltransferase domain-containing protein [Salinigranum rubrum]
MELAGTDDAYAAHEARVAATGVTVDAPGLAVARGVDRERIRGLAYTHRAAELVGHGDASVESARALLSAASIDRTGSVAVRARDVRSATGVSTREAEIELGSVLTDRGFSVDLDDPDHVLCAWFSGETCLLGWQVAESVRDFSTRQPTDRPFFQPGSMDPLDARWAANVAGGGNERRIVDPMCGTGGFLIEAGLVGSEVVGVDAQWKMTRGARENLAAYLGGEYEILRGDATALPLRDDCADGVVVDVPYGRQSKVATHSLSDLVSGALDEAARIAPRAVVVADRSWAEAAEVAGWQVEERFERRVHGSLTRHVHVLYRS